MRTMSGQWSLWVVLAVVVLQLLPPLCESWTCPRQTAFATMRRITWTLKSTSQSTAEKVDVIQLEKLPRHVAYIVDGNGRWASRQSLPRHEGHSRGANTTIAILQDTIALGIPFITLYLFSTENWSRPTTEVKHIFQLLREHLTVMRQFLLDQRIDVKVIGQIDRLPLELQQLLNFVGYKPNSSSGSRAKTVVTLALSYGGRDDLLKAVRDIASDVERKKMSPQDITEDMLSSYLSLGRNQIPDPDLIIRTSGEKRISNFLLWQSAYSEFETTSTLWPDFSTDENRQILFNFTKRERRFGKLPTHPIQ